MTPAASHTTHQIVSGFTTRADGGVVFTVKTSLHSIQWHFVSADKAHEWLASLSEELVGLQIDGMS